MRNIIFLVLCFLFLVSIPVSGNANDNNLSMDEFRKIPILHEGRMKPLESFAILLLDDISGQHQDRDASAWLAETLFNPQYAVTRPVFQIMNPDLRTRFNLPSRKSKLYSLEELSPYLVQTHEQALSLASRNGQTLTKEQEALVRLHNDALTYSQLLHAMTPFLPMQLVVPEMLGIKSGIYPDMPTWQEVKKKDRVLAETLQRLVKRKGEDFTHYTEEEKNLAILGFEFGQLQQAGAQNTLLRIIPPQWEKPEWLSPWALLEQGQGSPQSNKLLNLWQDMARSWRKNDAAGWNDSAAQAYKVSLSQSHNKNLAQRLTGELVYNALSPFKLAIFLYGFSALLAAAFFWSIKPTLYKVSMIAAITGTLAQCSGIILRIFILQRPPVGSLYESLLFVSLVIMICALIIELRRRDGTALISGTVSSLLILFIAPVVAPDGDDLQMLVAVLNTGFWLATHVICITAGYGVCVITAMLAHLYLFKKGHKPDDSSNGIVRSIYITSLVALLLTAVGTVLGGIWADQSWGRFWGWDPKENGALLIVLWLIWAHHGRIGGHLPPLLFNAALAFLNVIVALAWFGVNLLSVGLHSYGFISGIATGLAVFCGGETLLIYGLWLRASRRQKTKRAEII